MKISLYRLNWIILIAVTRPVFGQTVECTGTESGGNGPRQYSYPVTDPEGTMKWVGRPGWYSNLGSKGYDEPCRECNGGNAFGEVCVVDSDCPDGECAETIPFPAGCDSPRAFLSALLVDAPYYRDWSQDSTFTYIRDDLLIPLATYEVAVIDEMCPPDTASSYSPPLTVCWNGANHGAACTTASECPGGSCVGEITTARYGDSLELAMGNYNGPSTVCSTGANAGRACYSDVDCPSATCGVVNVFDLLGSLAAFEGIGPDKPRQDHLGAVDSLPDGIISIVDVVETLGAFGGQSYPFDVPSEASRAIEWSPTTTAR